MSTKKPTPRKTSRSTAKRHEAVAVEPAPKATKAAKATKADVKQQISEVIEQARESSRERMLAGLGMIARLRKQREERMAELVEEGKRFEPKVKKAIEEIKAKLPKADMKIDWSKFKGGAKKFDTAALRERMDKGRTEMLHKVGLATRKEVQSLARKVEKIAELQAA